MQFSTIIVAAIMAFTATAAPWYPTGGEDSGPSHEEASDGAYTTGHPSPAPAPPSGPVGNALCPQTSDEVCCHTNTSGNLIGVGLTCTLSSLLGSTCTNQQICCVNNGNGNQVCTNSNGAKIPISIPIAIFGYATGTSSTSP